MKRPSPIVIGLLWAIGIALLITLSARFVLETEPNWIWVAVAAVIAFAMPYYQRPAAAAGFPHEIKSPLGNSPEAAALVHALFIGGFMLVWGLGVREPLRHTLLVSGIMAVHWYLATREELYAVRGVTDYPARWLKVDYLFAFLIIGAWTAIIVMSFSAPDRISRQDRTLALAFLVPVLGAAYWFTRLRKERLAELTEKGKAASTPP